MCVIYYDFLFFQYEEYQGQMDHSIKRMTKNLQRTRTFWENGLDLARQNQNESVKANNIARLRSPNQS